jgi:hypothetical protein
MPTPVGPVPPDPNDPDLWDRDVKSFVAFGLLAAWPRRAEIGNRAMSSRSLLELPAVPNTPMRGSHSWRSDLIKIGGLAMIASRLWNGPS